MACALHPNQPPVDTCANCGHFMCMQCSAGATQVRCPACRASAEAESASGGPLALLLRSPVGFGPVWTASWGGFKREPVMLGLAAFLTLLIGGAAGTPQHVVDSMEQQYPSLALVLAGVTILLGIVQVAVQGPLQMGQMRMSARALAAQPVDGLQPLFSQWRKLPSYVACVALLFVLVLAPLFAGAALLGVWAAVAGYETSSLLLAGGLALSPLALWFLLPLLLIIVVFAFEEDAAPVSAIRRCYALARNRRLLLLGLTAVSSAVLVLGFLLCCIGFIPAYGFVQTLWTATYLRLREEERAPAPA
jgi:hypothetical protein